MNLNLARKKVRKSVRALGRITQLQPKLKYYYGYFYRYGSVKQNTILFESFHGKTISDSPLYLLKEFLNTPESKNFKIYYSTANPEEHAKFIAAHNLPVELVSIHTRKYPYVLATCQYLVNNSSFPAYFIKRKKQSYLQTWHGTPLKTLGKRMRLGIESMYNVQHNFLQASHIIFPNEFTRNAMMRDYNLDDLYCGKVAMCGYPRNSVFFQEDAAVSLRKQYELEGLECLAYMPTWRGTSNHDIQIDSYKADVLAKFDIIDAQLRDDQRLFVNFHPLVASEISLGDYKHILPFPADADNYQFLNAMDGLITDYSSVFFDFSVTRKPIILFVYDIEEYLHDRGMYLDIESLPFQKVYTPEALGQLISSGAYKEESYSGTDYERDFLQHESKNNSKNALDFLFDSDSCTVDFTDYSFNKKRKWQAVRVEKQRTIEQLNTICRSINPGTQIAVFYRHTFTQEKSTFLHDNYRDVFNFVFVTKTTPRTLLESVRSRFSKRAKKGLANRETKRVFADLTISKTITDAFSWEKSTYICCKQCRSIPCHAQVVDGMLDASFILKNAQPTHLLVMRKNIVIWSRELSPVEAGHRHFQEDFSELMEENRFKERTWIQIGLGCYNEKTLRKEAILLSSQDGATSAYVGGLSSFQSASDEDFSDDSSDNYADEYEGESPVAQIMPAACFRSANGTLQLYLNTADKQLMGIEESRLRSIKVKKGSIFVVSVTYSNHYPLMGAELVYRSKTEQLSFPLPHKEHKKGDHTALEITIDTTKIPLKEIYWDFYLVVEVNGTTQHIPAIGKKALANRLALSNVQAKDGTGNILFPQMIADKRLAFTYRPLTSTDNMLFKLKELAAFVAYMVLHPYWTRKRVWLVYEKFCSNAQDNGFYFFEYCMTQLPPEKAKHVFFVIDKDSPDFANVKPYMSNVIIRFSFKHLLYCMVSKIYIASDSRSHLYVWRPKPNLISRRIRKRRIFFLQHGVTALKRVDVLFGKNGSSPMTYFLTTSKNEQDIVVEHFKYQPEKAPILGFSRWDLLKDLSDKDSPSILVMPTWRPWLEEQSQEVFEQSDYFMRYSSLVKNPQLAELLERYNVTLRFFIHPKLSELIGSFISDNPRIQIVKQGTIQLNRLLMESSMLITDYSSVCWDELYMNKPVLFYHFDSDLYEEVTGSYLDLSCDLPGPICKEEDQLIDQIEDYIVTGFALHPEDQKIADDWFPHRDTKNRERIFNFIESKGF